jgi:DNA-binding NtrC family response regulator
MPESALSALMAGASLSAKKILIVEDSYPIAESMSRAIAEVGFTTVGLVDTADRAMRKIEQDVPDGVLLDVSLREGSAVALANVLRRRKVPFVVVSAYAHDTLPTELRQAPYLAKPMSEVELIETVRRTFDQ